MGILGFGLKVAKTIKSVKPVKKIAGSKTIDQIKTRASAARASSASFNYKAGIGKAMRKMKDIKWEPTLK